MHGLWSSAWPVYRKILVTTMSGKAPGCCVVVNVDSVPKLCCNDDAYHCNAVIGEPFIELLN
jgi:hypothetical protein